MQRRAPHSGRRKAWFALVILLAAAALGLFAAGVGLLGTDPDECSATAEVRRLEEVHATERAEPTRAAAIDRPPHPPAAEASAAEARAAAAEAKAVGAPSSRRRRLCAASDCTELAYMAALFDAMRVDIINTGDAKVADLLAAFRTIIPFNKFGGALGSLLSMSEENNPDSPKFLATVVIDKYQNDTEQAYTGGLLSGTMADAGVMATVRGLYYP